MKVKNKFFFFFFFLPFSVEIKVIILIYISYCDDSHLNPNIFHFGFKRILIALKHIFIIKKSLYLYSIRKFFLYSI